ncbi:MAG: DnaJ domain-containing protein [Deltaproteobacteria bacterium]|nr:DnaJ domain-containing protein [Deltaproteobacteria bacterium]
MTNMDYYKTLGLSEDASEKEIKEAYRRLAFQYHPDRNQDPESSARMKAFNEAYAVLSNPTKRREYDAVRRQFGPTAHGRFRSTYTENDIFRGSDINRIFEEMASAFGLRGFEEIFKEAYGEGYRSFEFKRPGFAARGFVFTGIPRNRRTVQAGKPPLFYEKLSRYFLRKFTGVELPERGPDVIETIELTVQEARDGGPYPFFYRKKSKKIVINVPPRLREGQRIRLAGMGEEGRGGGNPGDLYLRVKIRKPLRERLKSYFTSLKNQIDLLKP